MTAKWEIEADSDEKARWLAPFVADMNPGEDKLIRRGDGTIWHVVMQEGFMQAIGSVTATLIAREAEEDDAEAEGSAA
jgi:hypothetical protein